MMKKICLVGACALLGTLAAEAKIVFNGMCVGKHQGAFTAFGAALTPYVVNHDNILEITVDNFWDADIPPLCADYTVCGGLYRPVWLIETDRVCIDPVADGADGIRTTHYRTPAPFSRRPTGRDSSSGRNCLRRTAGGSLS